jgi:hypothetical protein
LQGDEVFVTLIATGLDEHARPQSIAVEAHSADLPAPKPPTRRPTRAATEELVADDVVPVMLARSPAELPSPSIDEDDLEVPSFLRRRGQRVAP